MLVVSFKNSDIVVLCDKIIKKSLNTFELFTEKGESLGLCLIEDINEINNKKE